MATPNSIFRNAGRLHGIPKMIPNLNTEPMFRVFRVQGLGFRVEGLRLRV